MTSIFISYSRKDSAIAHKLMAAFQSVDLDVWVDWEDIPPAVGWLDQILQGIEQADAFVFLVSPDSIKSEVCNVELEHAHKNAKRIIPILVRDVNAKDATPIVRDLNWILSRGEDDFDKALENIKRAINLDVDWLREHRRLQVRALDWDRRKDPSLLLRGGDLRSAIKIIVEHEKGDPIPSELQKMYISFSRRSERLRTITYISTALALTIMVILSIFAWNQRQAALANADEARNQTVLAQKSEALAIDNARAALAAKAKAINNENIAKAQRSAARAQIFQNRTGGLFTSTLFAIDSMQRNPSAEAESILRKNISLLPIPVSQTEQGGSILHIEVSPDGTSFVSTSNNGTACLIRFEDGEELFCVNSSGSVLDAVFSPDGKMLVTSDSKGEVKILDASDGNLIKQINLGVAVRDVNISPDKRVPLLAMARDDARITLIKLSNYEFAGEFSVSGSLRVTAFSPDGEWFAAASNLGAITFWNLGTGKIISGGAHRGEVFEIAFSPNSLRLISGAADNCAVLTSPSSGKQVLKVLNEDRVTNVAFGPDGSWFVTSSDDFRIRVWDADSGEERFRFLQDSIVKEVQVSPDGLWIASTGSDRTVRVWSAANGAEMFQIPLRTDGNALAFSEDSRHIVIGDSDGNISIWDISALRMNIGYLRFDEYIGNIEMSPNGKWFAASTQGQVWVLNPDGFSSLTTPQVRPILDFKPDAVTDLEIDPQGNLLALSTTSGKVVIANVSQGGTRTLISSGPAQAIAFSPDAKSLLLGGEDGLLQYRSVTASDNGVLWQGTGALYSLAVSASGQVAIGMDNKIVMFDLGSNSIQGALDSPGRNQRLKFSPDGKFLASSLSSGRTFIWQLQDGEFTQTAALSTSPATSLSFSFDDGKLFLGTTDEILVFDPLTGNEINRIRQKGDVTALTFSPDGNTLFSSAMRTLQIFDLAAMQRISSEDIIASACSRLTENFSASEWSFFFVDEDYRKTCESLPEP